MWPTVQAEPGGLEVVKCIIGYWTGVGIMTTENREPGKADCRATDAMPPARTAPLSGKHQRARL
jgi:hypothetical protein